MKTAELAVAALASFEEAAAPPPPASSAQRFAGIAPLVAIDLPGLLRGRGGREASEGAAELRGTVSLLSFSGTAPK